MYIARAIRLLILTSVLTACTFYDERNNTQLRTFEYRDAAGKVAVFDLDKLTIYSDGREVQFSDCSNFESICLESSKAKIVVPRYCNTSDASNDYLSGPSDFDFIGFEGLSGNIFKSFRRTDKFGYAYHFKNGIVQLVMIPDSVDRRITRDRLSIPAYTYRISGLKGPFACEANRTGD